MSTERERLKEPGRWGRERGREREKEREERKIVSERVSKRDGRSFVG